MRRDKNSTFAEKHGSQAEANPTLVQAVTSKFPDGELACASAFVLAKDENATPADIGKTVDLMNYRIVKCQLGLFGYTPNKKKFVAVDSGAYPEVDKAILAVAEDQKIPCTRAWEIADRMQISKLTMGSICEGLNMKISDCQLGAF